MRSPSVDGPPTRTETEMSEKTQANTDAFDATAEIRRRLGTFVQGEEMAWAKMNESREKGWSLADRIEGSETLIRDSIRATHAARLLTALTTGGIDALAGLVEEMANRVFRGGYVNRSTCLLHRAKGEIETDVVRNLVVEMRALIDFARDEMRKAGAR
jgi:hypothetical protein